MNKEYFKILKEISSLELAKSQLEYESNEELARVEKLRQRRQLEEQEKKRMESELEELKSKAVQNENHLSLASSKLEKIKADLAGSVDSKNVEKMEAQSQRISAEIDLLENEGFKLLEDGEKLENDIEEKGTFLAGISETIEEIKAEVDKVWTKNQKKIDSLVNRIENIKKQLPENFARIYEQVTAKNLSTGAFTSIASGKCDVCKMGVDKTREKEVEENLALKTCSSCGRIFIPKESLY